MKGKMSSDTTSYSGLEGIVVTCTDPQAAASSDAVDHLKSKETTECSDVMENLNHKVAATETFEFEDDLPVFIMKFKAFMRHHQLSQRVVAPVLSLSQSHLCDLLNAKKQGNSWSNIATAGRRPYQRMKKVMEDEMILNALSHNRDVFREHSKKKRSINSRPYNPNRLTLTIHQKKILEDAYTLAKYPSLTEYEKLATTMGITLRQVKTWFNNRRKLRCCPPSSPDENSYIEPMPESVSRGVIVEEFRVENGDVVAIEPYMCTDGDTVVSLPQNATLDTHDAMGENEDETSTAEETLGSYLEALDARKVNRTETNIGKENNVGTATSREGNVIEIYVDGQELKTNSGNKTDQLAEVVRNGGHIEVKDGVVVMTRPFPSLGGHVVMPSKDEEGGARIDHDTSPPLNPQGSFGEGLGNDRDRIPSTLVVPSEKEGKTVNDDISGDEGLVAVSRQQSSASYNCTEKKTYKMTDIQLNFLQLTLEMHGNPSQEILDALSVLTCLEKVQIVEWFKKSLKGKTL